MISTPLVSVVTPVYNGADFLAECIDSVLRQTHPNWSMAIVDNASTDATPDIASRYASRESRIRHVRYDDFLPAVNDSINRALTSTDPASDWCKMVLADDWIYPECLERMLAVGEDQTNVGVVSSYQRWGDRVHLTHLPYNKNVVEGPTVLGRTFLYDENVTGNPTALMFRAQIIREQNPFYDRRLNHADTDAAYRTLVDHDLGFVHQVLSFARRQGGTNIDRSDRIGSAIAENLLSVVRYGPAVMDDASFGKALRMHLRRYSRYLAIQSLRPSRHNDAPYIGYHRRLLTILGEDARSRDRGLKVLRSLGAASLFPLPGTRQRLLGSD
jgi:glycosyltransferase involved in cell wall biosynthesis